MSQRNRLWGAPRIHGELLKLGIEAAESTVAKYIVKRPRRPGQSWTTFLRNQAAGIAATDLFVVPTIGFKLPYCLVFLAHSRRELVRRNGASNGRMGCSADDPGVPVGHSTTISAARSGCRLRPRREATSTCTGIRDRPTAPRSPWQNAYVARLIGSVRRECLDRVIVLGELHLRRMVSLYAGYYNRASYCPISLCH
jgi:transposase InsO family protein